jgi:polysaccharide deacetylase family sporulation protein PdaB
MFYKGTYIAAIAVIAVLAVATAIPAFNSVFIAVNASRKKLPVYSVERDDRKISVSFDAAWGADDTDELLAILAEFNVKATFFLCGYWVEKHPDEVKRIYDAGHDIGNHGDTHAHGAQLSLEQNKREILGVHNKVRDLLGIEMDLFRPPFGEYNNTVLSAAEALGYFTIQWDVDSHDWMNRGPAYEINQVLNNKNLKNGSIILFHNDAKDTPITLRPILQGLVDKGFEIVPISQLIHRENFSIDHTGRQKLSK